MLFAKFVEHLLQLDLSKFLETTISIKTKKNKKVYLAIKILGNIFEEEEEEVLITVKDETELKELRNAMELMDKFSLIGTLASGLAHEIKNPLTVIKGHIYILKTLTENPEVLDSINVISYQTERILKIINMLLNFSKNSNTEKCKLNLTELIKNTIIITNPNAIKKGVKIINNMRNTYYINGSKMEIEELFLNLILNAVESINHSNGMVIINASEDKNYLNITIEDNGPGIPEEVLPDIFNPFFTTKPDGNGLGLSICYKIVKSHNGKIKVESKKNKGTTIFLKLPLYNKELCNE